jgi:integrase
VAIAHRCALGNHENPFKKPRLSKIMRGLKSKTRRASVPRRPFKKKHIRFFMDIARGTNEQMLWRAAVALVLCYHEFLRASEAFGIRLEDIKLSGETGLSIWVRCAKNHKDRFSFHVDIEQRAYCAGRFVRDFLTRAGFVPGESGFLCSRILREKFVRS